jgi:hypothetical protein
MHRDMDLIRKIMIEARERCPQTFLPAKPFDGYDEATVVEHFFMIRDCGLAEVLTAESQDSRFARIERLTPAGHDFVEAALNDTIWRSAWEWVRQKGGGVPLAVLTELLKQLAVKHFKLPG